MNLGKKELGKGQPTKRLPRFARQSLSLSPLSPLVSLLILRSAFSLAPLTLKLNEPQGGRNRREGEWDRARFRPAF